MRRETGHTRWLGWSLFMAAGACGAPPTTAVENPAPDFPPPIEQDADSRFQQGAVAATGWPGDLALIGPGFLVVAAGGAELYVRGGHFAFDEGGYYINPVGERLRGAGQTNAPAVPWRQDLRWPWTRCQPTSDVFLSGNLDPQAAVAPDAVDPAAPVSAPAAQSRLTVFGNDGYAHNANVFFRRVGAAQWFWYAVRIVLSPDDVPVMSGQLVFDQQGALADGDGATAAWDLTGVGPPQPIVFHFAPVGVDTMGAAIDGVWQRAGGSRIVATAAGAQDCTPSDAEVSNVGELSARNGLGERRTFGTLALVRFTHPAGLIEVVRGVYQASAASGPAVSGAFGKDDWATLVPGAIETQP